MKRIKSLLLVTAIATFGVTIGLADSGAAHKTKQTLPIKLGTSGGSASDRSNAFCCGGTLGSAVMCDGTLQILSNNHVLGRSGSAVLGEDDVQPGLIDTGCSSTNSNIVGDFAGDKVPLGTANVDAALSVARAGAVSTSGEIIDIGVPCTSTNNAAIGMAVQKSGRTSGYTTGTVQAINVNVSIQYQRGCNSGKKFTVGYTNQVSITPGTFLVSGDSGSLMLDMAKHPVGLLFAGSSSIAIANPIQSVVNAFSTKCGGGGFSFVGTSCAAPTSQALTLGPVQSEIDYASMVKDRHIEALMNTPAVLGVGVGAADDNPDEAVLVLYLEQGRAHPPIPDALDGVRVKIVRTDPIVSMVGSCGSGN
jgi:hypothetical protein